MYQQPQQPQQQVPSQAPEFIQPQQPQQQQPQSQPQSQPYNFSLDSKTVEILQAVYPELTNAMVCVAIKKFSSSDDYLNYFIRDEFKASAVQEAQDNIPAAETGSTPVQAQSAISFSNW